MIAPFLKASTAIVNGQANANFRDQSGVSEV
jgi:hypothetical protein